MRRALVLAAVDAALAPAAAEAKTYRIAGERGLVVKLRPYRPADGPELADASAALGAPSKVDPTRGACHVTWAGLRLRALFTSFGGESDLCNDGLFQSAVVKSRMWVTWRGLRVGMASKRVPELHRNARFARGKWV